VDDSGLGLVSIPSGAIVMGTVCILLVVLTAWKCTLWASDVF